MRSLHAVQFAWLSALRQFALFCPNQFSIIAPIELLQPYVAMAHPPYRSALTFDDYNI
jgi:hypothetical protein